MEQVEAILDARQAVRDLSEVVFSELLLAAEVERAMVGRDELQVILDEPAPELVLVVGRTKRRGADEFCPFESVAHVID